MPISFRPTRLTSAAAPFPKNFGYCPCRGASQFVRATPGPGGPPRLPPVDGAVLDPRRAWPPHLSEKCSVHPEDALQWTANPAMPEFTDDPASLTDIQKLLETAVAVYTAKCGPLERSSAAWLMLKAISHCVKKQECRRPLPNHRPVELVGVHSAVPSATASGRDPNAFSNNT